MAKKEGSKSENEIIENLEGLHELNEEVIKNMSNLFNLKI